MNMKVLGIVVLYYPGEEVKEHILSYVPWLDGLIIWDNTPASQQPVRFDKETEQKILRMGRGVNAGMGIPLNEAVRYGLENGFTHLLTMDQDSCFGEGMFARFIRLPGEVSDPAVVSFSANTHPYDESRPAVENVEIGITSGTVYRLDVFKETGGFREDFFIDGVDTEFCFRLRRRGWKMVRLNEIYMHHVLGNRTVTPFLWGKLVTPNYPAQRTYYLTRNTLIIWRMYPEYRQSEGWFKMLFFWRPVCILLVEPDKWRKFKALFLGICHAAKKRTGEYAIE